MEVQMSRPGVFDKRLFAKSRTTAVRWVKDWVPQDLLATGGKSMVFRWVREDFLTALKEKSEAAEEEAEPEPMTEVLFLCSYEGCGKTFIDAGALRKHSHIHGERQYICHYEGCGKKFVDSSKLKRHFLIHTGERAYVCPHEGCGKAFSLDFNLRAHMKTHSQENYHICPYVDCGKRFAHDYKLQAHMKSHHEKAPGVNTVKHTPPAEKVTVTKAPPSAYASTSADRPYLCPYEGCGKAYIHEYKLNLHLKKEHPRHRFGENGKHTATAGHDMDESNELDTYAEKYPYGCPYEGCGKAYIHEYKLNLHLKKEHPGHNPEENGKRLAVGGGHENDEVGDHNVVYHGKNGYFCPYEGCGKSYIHEYKLNLHLKKEHPGHNSEEKDRRASVPDHDADEANERSPYIGKNTVNKNHKRGKVNLNVKVPPPKIARKDTTSAPANSNLGKKQWSANDAYEEEDSEETEDEDHENINEDGWGYQEANEDDEETEDED